MSEPEKKKLPPGLIVVFVLLGAVCLGIVFFMQHGFYLFNTYQPTEEPTSPSIPGFP
ncbi:MAG: hypothetical protein ACE5FN_03370 [Leptospirillia bacterium]